MHKNLNQNLTRGFTLVEILIAMTISLLLMGLLLEIFLASRRSFQLQCALLEIEENARKAIEILTSEIQKAGMIGCARLSQDFPIVPFGPFTITVDNKLSGNSSEITIRYAEFNAAVLIKNMHNQINLTLNKSIHFAKQDILLIADCTQAELFQVERIILGADKQNLIASTALHHRYEKNAEISRFVINKFFIAKTRRVNQEGKPIYALFVEDRKHRKTELVAGVYQLSFLYSLLRNGKIIESSFVANADRVIGIAIKLELAYFPLKKTWFTYVALR